MLSRFWKITGGCQLNKLRYFYDRNFKGKGKRFTSTLEISCVI